MIDTGVYPSLLKNAKVTPVYKDGDKVLATNYRSISVLPSLSKVLERHVSNNMYKYLFKFKNLHPTQSGFRPHHSCQTALIDIIDKWLQEMNDYNLNLAILLDFKKAFDLVDHDILCLKLAIYGFNESAVEEITTTADEPIKDVITEVYETMKAETSFSEPPCACSCRSTNNKSTQPTATSKNTTVHMSLEEIQESVDKIVREIKVSKNSTSQYKRKFKSAPDDRFSAQVIGISGVSIVGIISLVVVGFDLKNLYDAFETMYHRLKDLSKTRSIP
ncbi:Hypothetical predicted protein [Mytilus galloprovincialis]|nr:Hypothetical predicted protein [Mytilus galloprovincialis]